MNVKSLFWDEKKCYSFQVFKWDDKLIKAQVPRKPGSQYYTASVWDGMTHADFSNVIKNFFKRNLGNDDHSSLIERTLAYADFNKDGQVRSLSNVFLVLL